MPKPTTHKTHTSADLAIRKHLPKQTVLGDEIAKPYQRDPPSWANWEQQQQQRSAKFSWGEIWNANTQSIVGDDALSSIGRLPDFIAPLWFPCNVGSQITSQCDLPMLITPRSRCCCCSLCFSSPWAPDLHNSVWFSWPFQAPTHFVCLWIFVLLLLFSVF